VVTVLIAGSDRVVCTGGTVTSVIGVGAMVTTSLAGAGYGLVNPSQPTLYTWSSRGPAADGSLGVSITAPGLRLSVVQNPPFL
jgi:tripeptidyl-peptidase II